MVVNYERTLAHACPFCSYLSKHNLNAFDVSGRDGKKFACKSLGCREECVHIAKKNNKYKITVECSMCGDTHTYTTDFTKFWSKRLNSYKCPVSNVDVMYFGDEDAIDEATKEFYDYYAKLVEFLDEPDESFESDELSEETDLLYDIIETVNDLQNKGKVSCVCGWHRISLQVMKGDAVLMCTRCKRMRVIETTTHNFEMVLNAEEIIIGN